ncbi:hypothetical protein GJ631_12335 [Natronomonas sp. CBA1123]|uniref:hypothetical protein n=1 Tax=Natronomonas sp. CBA1123 TaxID=2668070 RepID=UPI0012EB00D4|nr:hypothetical protein [Natronomonas sp. CBA1123]MUV87327.1 hypothetical protein [Natronomonas sp. CBA1123]
MDPTPNRRALLVASGATVAALAGCTDTLPGNSTRELPDGCPTSQDLDVEWPRELDSEAAASFLESYEHVYYRDEVVEYEPESRVDSYGLSVAVSDDPHLRRRGVRGHALREWRGLPADAQRGGDGGRRPRRSRPRSHRGGRRRDPP